jgi:hypothetical protein
MRKSQRYDVVLRRCRLSPGSIGYALFAPHNAIIYISLSYSSLLEALIFHYNRSISLGNLQRYHRVPLNIYVTLIDSN